jgi:hypothetical protein
VKNSEARAAYPKSLLVPVKQFAESGESVVWVHAVPIKTWHHPAYGEVSVTRERAERMLANFNEGVRGQDIATDYEHGLDPAKGTKASGWLRDMRLEDDGLHWAVEFTEPAKGEIDNDEWKYFSPEWYDVWVHPDTQEVYEDVVVGGGLTNRPYIKGLVPLNFSEVIVAEQVDEVADKEHAEPGTGTPPQPAPANPDNPDRAQGDEGGAGGSRRDTPPGIDAKLREILGLSEDADIVKPVEDLMKEVAPLREAAKAHSERKTFSEQYPDEWREMQELRKDRIENEAKTFSENYSRFKKKDSEERLTTGFSARVLNKLEDVHRKFSEGSVTATDIAELMDAVADNGIVDYSELGSSRFTERERSNQPGKAFAERVAEIQENDKVEYDAAIKLAADRHPDEYAEYRSEVAGRR